MADLRTQLYHKLTIIEAVTAWSSVTGLEQIKRCCYELIKAIDDEIERLDKVDGTKKEIRAIDEEIDRVLPRDDIDY